jgi:hypothetical protein
MYQSIAASRVPRRACFLCIAFKDYFNNHLKTLYKSLFTRFQNSLPSKTNDSLIYFKIVMSDDMSASPTSDNLGLTNEDSIYQNYTASEVLVQVSMRVNSLPGVDGD